MLKLRNVCKYYKEGKNKKLILDNINLDFKSHELVFILGASGSGKSTLLNIIAGNLRNDTGDILLNDITINKYSEKKLNNYRNNTIGYIFQDYNLIEYLSVWDNIMLGYNGGLSKVSINTLLKQLGIHGKKRMTVNKLSGGEKQRVAIARSLVNDPNIILADEPTGALDSTNGIEVMEILKKISKNKLVIVVSHDNNLASKYADRIINIKDGKCTYQQLFEKENDIKKKTNRIKVSSIKLAIKNLWLKRGRTIFTSLAISLGFISMTLVLTLANNFNKEIDDLEKRVVSIFPISISNGEYENNHIKQNNNSSDKINILDKKKLVHKNKITSDYLNYLDNIEEIKYKVYEYDVLMPIISDEYKIIDNRYFKVLPSNNFIDDNYEILAGRNIINDNEILVKIDSNNNLLSDIASAFEFKNSIDYADMVGKHVRIINNDLYFKNENDYYYINDNNKELYNNSQMELTVVGVVKEKEIVDDNSYILYKSSVIDRLIYENGKSRIVNSQLNSKYNLLGLDTSREDTLSYLGYKTLPSNINIYVDNLNDKEVVIKKLDNYNDSHDKLIYVDIMDSAISIIKDFVKIISVILIGFSCVAIVISTMMIGILTNIRVLERKKEIGILRSRGISKRKIVRMFNTENILIGLLSSGIGIGFLYLVKDKINMFLDSLLEIDDLFIMDYKIIGLVVIANILIIKLAGSIPSRKASKMDIVSSIYDR